MTPDISSRSIIDPNAFQPHVLTPFTLGHLHVILIFIGLTFSKSQYQVHIHYDSLFMSHDL